MQPKSRGSKFSVSVITASALLSDIIASLNFRVSCHINVVLALRYVARCVSLFLLVVSSENDMKGY